MKTSLIALLLFVMVMSPNVTQASNNPYTNDTLKTANGGEPNVDELPAMNPDEPFFFQEKVYIHIYDKNEKTLIDGAFSRKDLQENKVLRDLLRKSTRFLSLDSHHYYFVDQEVI